MILNNIHIQNKKYSVYWEWERSYYEMTVEIPESVPLKSREIGSSFTIFILLVSNERLVYLNECTEQKKRIPFWKSFELEIVTVRWTATPHR